MMAEGGGGAIAATTERVLGGGVGASSRGRCSTSGGDGHCIFSMDALTPDTSIGISTDTYNLYWYLIILYESRTQPQYEYQYMLLVKILVSGIPNTGVLGTSRIPKPCIGTDTFSGT